MLSIVNGTRFKDGMEQPIYDLNEAKRHVYTCI